MQVAEQLREALPGQGVQLNLGAGNFKAQFRRADRSGACLAVILGDAELERGVAAVKPLRREAGQSECPLADLPARVAQDAWRRNRGRVHERAGAVGVRAQLAAPERRCGCVAGVALAAAGLWGWRDWQAHKEARAAGRQRSVPAGARCIRQERPCHACSTLADQLVTRPSAHRLRRTGTAGCRAHAGGEQRAGRQRWTRLQQVRDSTSDRELALIVRLRIARLQIEQHQADAALDDAGCGQIRAPLPRASPKCAAMRCSPRAIATAR